MRTAPSLAAFAERRAKFNALGFTRQAIASTGNHDFKQRNETSLQEPIGSDKEGNEITINDVLGTAPDLVEESVATHIEARNVLHVIREQLPQRERDVMEMRYGLVDGKAKPQREIAQKLGISRSYVSRIEKRAVGMIHHAMEQNAKKRETASAAAKKLSS